ncbi:hypothetical protein SporoP37_11020 [Sporosarcina sp. P37]|uniref:DUF1177 domain-containing protein n=1 Tax=unclassified Sporosarcina TaxID=2647733 RepID=UPI0009BD7F43|nr:MULTISPECIES: DUF1177 domain-containing protein [unclassified Sporosarcina]ARD48625.1 hypothetical protein SporoP33_10610 [Sporosarcina sp. P33]ARK25131.1 hypothetical protein SporoP37_11020 [Sporosarcina sp. P37]PID17086.1 DUF1177 domain-containing protein [Sporosarcina sp. P35]
MSLKYTMDVMEILDDIHVSGKQIVDLFEGFEHCEASYKTVTGAEGSTDFVKIIVKGTEGRLSGGEARTLGIVGRLGGIGARPHRIGFVSDGDGAAAAVSIGVKLANMSVRGDRLPGDVIITTHICPTAPTQPHEPVDFMGSPVDILTMNQYEVVPEMDAVVSIDTTKGNRVINHRGIALSPTVKSGYVLKFSDELLRIMEMTTGDLPVTFAVTTQDITPYGNDVYHINSILQPAVATDAPVVGVAITAKTAVPGCGTGASHEVDVAQAVRFTIEIAKEYTRGQIEFYDRKEFERLEMLYGSMKHLQTLGNEEA